MTIECSSRYTSDAAEGKRGRCGRQAPLIDGVPPTCNPDDPNAHCCSNGGYCGSSKENADLMRNVFHPEKLQNATRRVRRTAAAKQDIAAKAAFTSYILTENQIDCEYHTVSPVAVDIEELYLDTTIFYSAPSRIRPAQIWHVVQATESRNGGENWRQYKPLSHIIMAIISAINVRLLSVNGTLLLSVHLFNDEELNVLYNVARKKMGFFPPYITYKGTLNSKQPAPKSRILIFLHTLSFVN
ncbi:hypothetical protein KIN20_012556 [Parelaphostrongylus tenuis]|uniref:Chitin-binding type-1 domain-containing protein n=1 Tax=Parelaphostrongylus tenuis TaxID=148309 RepID=A0AAD5MWD7_PARTN|nr:hypothetical protein KIN20_012556 [Parelaphostrongylus tenuis]